MNMKTTIQLHQLQYSGTTRRQTSHTSSLTLYTQEKTTSANNSLPGFTKHNSAGKVAIENNKMTNGVNSEISGPIDSRATQKTASQNRGGKIYVSCLETSLSTGWKRSLSQDSDKRESTESVIMSANNCNRNERNKVIRTGKGNHIGASENTDTKLQGSFKGSKRRSGKRLERQDSNVSIQLAKGKQISLSTKGKCTSNSESNLTTLSYNNSNAVHVKSKSNNPPTVLVQKSSLCRSITISEGSLSSAFNRHLNIHSKPSSTRIRSSSRTNASGINVQKKKNKRSFTISNDTTDGKLRTIYESTQEENE